MAKWPGRLFCGNCDRSSVSFEGRIGRLSELEIQCRIHLLRTGRMRRELGCGNPMCACGQRRRPPSPPPDSATDGGDDDDHDDDTRRNDYDYGAWVRRGGSAGALGSSRVNPDLDTYEDSQGRLTARLNLSLDSLSSTGYHPHRQ